jgi:predicted RNA-binding Zn-ribbon protein involved in translation (DUF1610 family)
VGLPASIYFFIGVLWAWWQFHYNRHILTLREQVGDRRASVMMVLTILLWPIEFIAVISYMLALLYYRFFPPKAEFVVVCPNCGRAQTWLGSDQRMTEAGWHLVRDDQSQRWFCPSCGPWEKQDVDQP